MFCRSTGWFICILVSAFIATVQNRPDSITGSYRQVSDFRLKSDSAESAQLMPRQHAEETEPWSWGLQHQPGAQLESTRRERSSSQRRRGRCRGGRICWEPKRPAKKSRRPSGQHRLRNSGRKDKSGRIKPLGNTTIRPPKTKKTGSYYRYQVVK